ncbi:MAG: hypothetical protein ACOYXB_15750 [Bacteroidota bacterium]
MKQFFPSFLLVLLLLGCSAARAQYMPAPIAHRGVYELLDELAAAHIIELHSVTKPYGRSEIARLLKEAGAKNEQLNLRQKEEVAFYMMDYLKEEKGAGNRAVEYKAAWLWFNKRPGDRLDLFHYRDTSFQLTVNPVFGIDHFGNNNGSYYHWWNGAEAWSTWGRFSFYGSLRDNHESTVLTGRSLINQNQGAANIKGFSDGSIDYEEMRGGVTYGWDRGHIGIMMDPFSWGEAWNGTNILSGRAPSFARLELSLNPVKWFRFEYIHGSLISEVVDSSRSYWITNAYGSTYREVYQPKFIAANFFTFTPFRYMELSIGNSVVYDFEEMNLAFFIPTVFFKAIDHALNAGIDNMNSAMFMTFSTRNIRDFHFYLNLFVDELQIARITDPSRHNFLSWKGGVACYLIPNLRLVGEYTWNNALVFRHFVPTTTFESNGYNLGSYIGDNAREVFIQAEFRPWRTARFTAWYDQISKGPDHTLLGTAQRDAIQPFVPIVWESRKIGILASFEVVNDLYLRLGYEYRMITGVEEYINLWTPVIEQGIGGTLRLGINIGF